MGRLLPALVTVLLVLSGSSPVLALDPGYARGLLKIGEASIPLTHAYVMRYENEEGVLDGPELRVLVSDREVTESLLSGPFLRQLEVLARKGAVRGILFRLNPRKLTKGTVQGTLLVPGRDPGGALSSFAIDGKGGSFERLETGGNRVTGQLRWQFRSDPSQSVEYFATFSAPFFQDVVTSRLSAKRAWASPQVQALLAFEGALREGRLDDVRNLSTVERFRELKAHLEQVGEQVFLDEVRVGIADAETRRRQLRAVFVRGANAHVIFSEGGQKNLRSLVNEKERWLVD